jgi:Sporulation and spore germination
VRRLLLAGGLGVALALVIGWLWFGGRMWRSNPGSGPGTGSGAAPTNAGAGAAAGNAPSPSAAPEDARRIRATLFYLAEDGGRLVGVDREVPYADTPIDQARRLIEALLKPADQPLLQAIPADTKLRAVFLTDRGEAYVDFSPEISTKHPGGSFDELLTVYAIVNTLTVNLPAITQVQILVEGHEVDTLAGHVDLRRPLAKNLTWTRPPEEAAPAPSAGAAVRP